MTLKSHAIAEFRTVGQLKEDGEYCDESQEIMCKDILELLDVFASQGHSVATAPYAIGIFSKLAGYENLSPLTGDDCEWREVRENAFQNKRCSAIFKEPEVFNGQPYHLDSVVFWEWYRDSEGEMSKAYFTSKESRQPIAFPYVPQTTYQFKPTEEFPNEVLD